jgi:diacylglycerol kinase
MRDFLGFRFAINGIVQFFKKERNGRIQAIIAILVLLLSFLFHLDKYEWLAVLICIALVLGLEMLNSAIEKLCNLITTEYHPQVKLIKDISAAAVLMVSILSVVIASVIFLPRIFLLLNQ